MPNWCEDKLIITGAADAVLAFRRANMSEGRAIDFERSAVRPMQPAGQPHQPRPLIGCPAGDTH
jgi:hypothetical protein